MGIISIILLVIFVISALLLIFLVLIQDEQGEGLGGIFGGGSSTPFGSRSGNVLTRFTTIIAAIFLFCSFGLAWVNRTPDSGDVIGAARRNTTGQQQGVEWWNENPQLEQQSNPQDQGTTTQTDNGAAAAPAAGN